jgi:hypothetical protein
MALVTTIHGDMDDSLLENKNGIDIIPEGEAHWNEYWLNGELVHRSVHLFIKEGNDLSGQAAVLA